jgi:hypothetical protein
MATNKKLALSCEVMLEKKKTGTNYDFMNSRCEFLNR